MMIEDEELRNLYQISSQEHLQKLESGLLHLQQNPENSTLWELWQEIHSLRGDSRSVGVETVEVLSHQIEEIIKQIERQEISLSTEVSDRLFMGLNAISLLVQEALIGQPSGVDTNLILEHLKAALKESPQLLFEFVDNNTIPQLAPTYIEDEELRNLYQLSTSEHLQKLETGLLHLQQFPDDDMWELQRSIHSLKVDSRSMGVETVEVLSHQIEEIIKQIERQEISLSTEVSDHLFMGLNAISLLVQEALTGQPSGVDTNLIIEHLKAVVSTSPQPLFEFVDNNIPQLAPTYIEDEELRNLYQLSTS
ncbi:MAG: Hpt domain-containing protein, partial [Rhizonema sp. PD37]|nr:Hpt domain-containing protein [Rhizonema sp. PD37]